MKQLFRGNSLHILLFVITVIATTIAGAEWMYGRSFIFGTEKLGWTEFLDGFAYSVPFLLFLTCHEFGHYFTARFYKVAVTLPYYIPFWLGWFFGSPSIGSMGAFIKIKSRIPNRAQQFDIGIAGPLAGFIIAISVLIYGFTHLPDPEHIYSIHPEYEQFGLDYADHVYDNDSIPSFHLGDNLLFLFFKNYVAIDPDLVPNPYEIIHYPWLFAGFLALLFTAINLLPIGQLDGGHVIYGLVGKRYHSYVSRTVYLIFLYYSGLGFVDFTISFADMLLDIGIYIALVFIALKGFRKSTKETLMYAVVLFFVQFLSFLIFPDFQGYIGWFFFAILIGRVVGVYHPGSMDDRVPLDPWRKVLGWLALIIFVLSFTPTPFVFS